MTTIRRLLLLAVLVLPAAACQTMEGFGEDVEAGGETIQDQADDE